jgi:PAS domain S-box-containing protein
MSSRLTSLLLDPGRLAALRQTNLLDTPAEEAFDRLVRQAAGVLEAPVALVSLIDEDRQVFKAFVGLPEPWASARHLALSQSLCQHLLVTRQPLVIPDTRRDPLARDNEFILALGVAAYLGIPLIVSGQVLGSLCVADRQRRDWTADQVAALTELAGLVMTEIQLRVDLASRGELGRRLADLEASYQALLERLPGVVYTLSSEAPNPVIYVSPQIQTLLGEPAADCISDPELWDRLVHPDDADWVAAECERTNQTGEPFAAEYRMRTRDGEVRWVRDEAVLVRGGDGRPLFWQGILTDITATRLTAERLAEALDREQDTAQQLAAALERERAVVEHLRAVDEMKTTFLQAVSHDLRTPLTTVLGIALTLERRGAGGLPADEVADLLHRLSGNARRLDRLLADLLDLDRLARGTPPPTGRWSMSPRLSAASSGTPASTKSMRWWWTPRRCGSRSTPPRWNGSWRTWQSTRPSTRKQAPPSGSVFNPSATGCCCWSRTRDRACRPSNGSGSCSPSSRAATSPTTHPAPASGWHWSSGWPACTAAAPGSRTALAAAPRSESSSPTPRAWTLQVPEPYTTLTFQRAAAVGS